MRPSSSDAALIINDVNQRGINHVKSKNYREAYVCFGQGLRLVRRTLAITASEGSFASSSSSDVETEDSEVCCCCTAVVDDFSPTKESSRMGSTQTTTTSYYCNDASQRRIISIHQEPMRLTTPLFRCGCSACHLKLAFVFLFNMALSNHLLGLKGTKSSSNNNNNRATRTNVSRALAFYEMAMELYDQGQDFALSIADYAALQRNMSHASVLLKYVDRSNSAVTQLLLSSDNTRMSEQQAQMIWEGFLAVLFNLAVFEQQDDHQTAPAA